MDGDIREIRELDDLETEGYQGYYTFGEIRKVALVGWEAGRLRHKVSIVFQEALSERVLR